MSVLLQRPHHVPGLITLNRQTPKSSPARQRQQQQRNTQPAIDRSIPVPVPVLSPKSNRKQQQRTNSISDSVQPVIATPTKSQPRRRQKSAQATLSDPTPTRRRSPRDALPEWDSPPKESELTKSTPSTPIPSAKRAKRPAAPTPASDSSNQINWQQASLLTTSPSDTSRRTPPLNGSHSTPSSPVARNPAPAYVSAPPVPAASFNVGLGIHASPSKRPITHTRAPSYPTLPMHRQKDTFYSGQNALEALFNANPAQGHIRGASTSLGSAHLHARMAEKDRERQEKERRRNDAFAAFAGASFQAAPNAISMGIPSIFGRLASLDLSSDESDDSDDSFDGGVIDLGEPEASKDDIPAFLM